MKIEKAKGIILKTNLFQEADLIVQVLLSTGARKDFIAKSALKSKRRFSGGVLEPSHFIEFSYRESSSAINYLEEAKIVEAFDGLRNSYERLQIAMEGLQLAIKVGKEDLEQEEIFHLLGNYLRLCAESEASKKHYLHFKIRLLTMIGILPSQMEFALFQQTPLSKSNEVDISATDLREVEKALRPYKEDYLS